MPCSRPTRAASTSTSSTGTSAATTARSATPGCSTTSRATSVRSATTTAGSSIPPTSWSSRPARWTADGYFNFGASNLWHGAIASRAKVVIVEVNPALPYVHGIDNGLHASEVDYVIDGHGEPPPELPNSAPTHADRAVAPTDRERDRGRRLPADRHRRHAERRVLPAAGQRRARPRRAHRDAHRRDHRPLPGRCRDRRQEDDAPRQGRLQLRSRLEVALRGHRRQPRHLVPAGRADEPAAPHHAERPDDGDQQHDPDGSPRPGRERVERSPSHQRHRWPAAVHPRLLRREGRPSRSSACRRPTSATGSARAGSC